MKNLKSSRVQRISVADYEKRLGLDQIPNLSGYEVGTVHDLRPEVNVPGLANELSEMFIELPLTDYLSEVDIRLSNLEQGRNWSEAQSKELHRYLDRLQTAHSIAVFLNHDLRSLFTHGDTCNSAKNEGIKELSTVVELFKAKNPGLSTSPEDFASTFGIHQFLEHYKHYSQSKTNSMGYSIDIQDIIDRVSSKLTEPKVSKFVGGKLIAQRLAEGLQNTKFAVAGPLYNLLKGNYDDYTIGQFCAVDRICYLNFDAIRRIANNDQLTTLQLADTIVHEFLHSRTDTVYRVDLGDDPAQDIYRTLSIWPNFISEGLVQQASIGIVANIYPEHLTNIVKNNSRSEAYQRRQFSDNPRQMHQNPMSLRFQATRRLPYYNYRLLIDTIGAKSNWQMAGIDRKEAEKALSVAFFDYDYCNPDQDTTARKKYMNYLHQATHPGFLQKLDYVIEELGSTAALDILESPSFNPSDPTSFTKLISKNRLAQISKSELRANQTMFWGEKRAPESDLLQELALYREAKGDYKSQLREKFGYRKRKLSPEEILHRRAYGLTGKPQWQYPTHTNGSSYSSLTAWQELQDGRRGMYF